MRWVCEYLKWFRCVMLHTYEVSPDRADPPWFLCTCRCGHSWKWKLPQDWKK